MDIMESEFKHPCKTCKHRGNESCHCTDEMIERDIANVKYAMENHSRYFVECPEGHHPCCTCFYMQKGKCIRDLNGHQNMMSDCNYWKEKDTER